MRIWDDLLTDDDRIVADHAHVDRRVGTVPALLMVDLYLRVFGDGPEPLEEAIERFPSSCGMSAWNALPPLRQLLGTARTQEVEVIHTTGEPRREADLGGASKQARDPRDIAPPEGYRIMPDLVPGEEELVIYKTRASAFFGSPLSTALRLRGIDTLVVAGETTSGCVRATAVDAYSHGLSVVIVEEATFDRSPTSHKINLYDLHHKYATVASLDTVARYLVSKDTTTFEQSI